MRGAKFSIEDHCGLAFAAGKMLPEVIVCRINIHPDS
jgi:hypothetical protein